MDRDKGNPKNGTFWGFRGGGTFLGPPGYPPLLWRGVQDSRFQGPVFGTPFGGSGLDFPKPPPDELDGGGEKTKKLCF